MPSTPILATLGYVCSEDRRPVFGRVVFAEFPEHGSAERAVLAVELVREFAGCPTLVETSAGHEIC